MSPFRHGHGFLLGALGFIGHPKLSAENSGASGEYGLLDQLAAIQSEHFRALTGDDNRMADAGQLGVTTFGSLGCVRAQPTNWPACAPSRRMLS